MNDVRRLVVGCDGTWNEPDQLENGETAPTNVVKFLNALADLEGLQVQHYEQGVGSGAWEALPGGIYGYGFEKRILGAYRFLRSRFADRKWTREQNRIFLIGFSRGAYTARRLAGVIAHSGIPVKASDAALGWELYRQRDQKSAAALKREGRFFDVPIEMVGVWDTVKATNDADYHDDQLSTNVVAGYHAMAIDERRKLFPILRWSADPRALELWFPGVHSDVGGGYADASLSDVALRWMLFRGQQHGLQFRSRYVDEKIKPSVSGMMHDSLTGVWKTLGESVRTVLPADHVHGSIAERMAAIAAYRPVNLPSQPSYWTPTPTGATSIENVA